MTKLVGNVAKITSIRSMGMLCCVDRWCGDVGGGDDRVPDHLDDRRNHASYSGCVTRGAIDTLHSVRRSLRTKRNPSRSNSSPRGITPIKSRTLSVGSSQLLSTALCNA